MRKRIFSGMFLAAVISLVCGFLLITWLMYDQFQAQVMNELTREAELVSAGIEDIGEDYLYNLPDSVGRVTHIMADGTVIHDTQRDAAEMENHLSREEIAAAFENGEGSAVRYSNTLSERTVYYAKRLPDGSVIRLSDTQSTIWTMLSRIALPILIILFIALLIAVALSGFMSKSIVDPINSIDPQNPDTDVVYKELYPLVNKIVERNVDMNKQMEEFRHRHTEFTANVSHELKTPLTSIYGISEMLMSGIVKPEDVAGFARNINDESGRMITLINDIIRLARLDENVIPLEEEDIDLFAAADDVINRLRSTADKQGIFMTLRGESVNVRGARAVVSEMIYNICDNAIKYNKQGGKVIVTVGKGSGGKGACVIVEDTGIGIPEKDIDRVLERFYRVDKSHSKKIGGTGLGLSIVKHSAAILGGTVAIESREGAGTRVTVVIP